MQWRRFNGEEIHYNILDEVEKTIVNETKNGNKLKVCIGTDGGDSCWQLPRLP